MPAGLSVADGISCLHLPQLPLSPESKRRRKCLFDDVDVDGDDRTSTTLGMRKRGRKKKRRRKRRRRRRKKRRSKRRSKKRSPRAEGRR